jgi:hypothetical protein
MPALGLANEHGWNVFYFVTFLIESITVRPIGCSVGRQK